MSPTAKHPNDVALAAYALGKLDAAKADTVRAHLEACETCRLAAEQTPADTFVRRLREARGRSKAETPAPSVARTGVQPPAAAVVTNVQPPLPFIDDETPPALRDHPVLKVEKMLGRGGMGAVYLAHHAMLDKPVAVKVMAAELVADEKSVARFQAEIRAVAKLDHPNIVRALDAQTAGGLHLFVMEYVDGQRLDEVVAARGRLAVDYACKCARLAALGLQHAHEKGLAHRDFKPQNLMLSKTGQVKILDFGLAKLAAASASRGGMTSQGVILGTPEYMAPEQARDTSTAGPPADIYALGATLFYLLTGQPPFTGTTAIDIVVKQLNDVPPRVTDLRPDVPAGLADLIARLLAKDIADRPPSAKDVAEALGPYTKKPTAPRSSSAAANPLTFDALPSLTTTLRKPAKRRRWPWMVGAAAVCGIALAVAAVVFSVKTADGTIVVTVNEPDAEVFVDGERITVTRKGDEPIEIRKAAGKHTLEVKKGGFKVESRDVTLTANGREPVEIRLLPLVAAKPQEPRKEEPQKPKEILPPPDKQEMPAKRVDERTNPEKPTGENGKVPPAPLAEMGKDSFVPLFNGKDLTGWKAIDGSSGSWSVQDGLIVCGWQTGFLLSERNDFENFHVRAEVLIGANSNSGLFFRSTWQPGKGLGNDERFYEVEISTARTSKNKIGTIMRQGHRSVERDFVFPGQWFTLELIAVDNRFVTKLNGEIAHEFVDHGRHSGRGCFALQKFTAETLVKFRKFEVKELPGSK